MKKKKSVLDNEYLGVPIIILGGVVIAVIGIISKIGLLGMDLLLKVLPVVSDKGVELLRKSESNSLKRKTKKAKVQMKTMALEVEKCNLVMDKSLKDDKGLGKHFKRAKMFMDLSEITKYADENSRLVYAYSNEFYLRFFDLISEMSQRKEKLDIAKLKVITYLGDINGLVDFSYYRDLLMVSSLDERKIYGSLFNKDGCKVYNLDSKEITFEESEEFMISAYKSLREKGMFVRDFKNYEIKKLVKEDKSI